MGISKLLVIISTIIALSSCSLAPKTIREKMLDDIYPILSYNEYQEISSINSKEELVKSINEYWDNVDVPNGMSKDEFRAEYKKRLKYANEHYPDRKGWGRSDRKRVYLLYGPPSYIERKELTNIQLSRSTTIKSLEIWMYMSPGNNNSLPSQGDEIHFGEKKFIFADETGAGFYKALYSSEESEYFDSRLLLEQQ